MRILFIILACYFSHSAYGQEMVRNETSLTIKGIYQAKPLFLQNPFNENGVGFCVEDYQVNGEPACPPHLGESSFEIDLSCYDLEIGDSIVIVINHGKGCMPKLLNPESCLPKVTTEYLMITVDSNGLIEWSLKMN